MRDTRSPKPVRRVWGGGLSERQTNKKNAKSRSTPFTTTDLVPLEAPGSHRLPLYPHHPGRAGVGFVSPIPRGEMVEDQRLGFDLLGEERSHDRCAVTVADGVTLDIRICLALPFCCVYGGGGGTGWGRGAGVDTV